MKIVSSIEPFRSECDVYFALPNEDQSVGEEVSRAALAASKCNPADYGLCPPAVEPGVFTDSVFVVHNRSKVNNYFQ